MTETAEGYTLVGFDDQHYVARIGSIVLIPLTNAYVVAEVTGLQERPGAISVSEGSKYLDDASQATSRQLSLAPVGTLPFDENQSFGFGVSEFPSLYADVLHAENRDLDRIFNIPNQEVPAGLPGGDGTRLTSLSIGTSVVFRDYEVKIGVDDFFGAHSAILGNTGSGKSCTIASLLQSALGKPTPMPAGGATFIIFDTNGEYRNALSELPDPLQAVFANIPVDESPSSPPPVTTKPNTFEMNLSLPHWLLNLDEWELLLQASDRVQRPVLRNALGLTTLFSGKHEGQRDELRNHILASALLHILLDSESATVAHQRISGLLNIYEFTSLGSDEIRQRLQLNYGKFSEKDQSWLREKLKDLVVPDATIPPYRNVEFGFDELGSALELAILYEESHGNRRVRDNCSTLLTRVDALTTRSDFKFLRGIPDPWEPITVESFVDDLLGLCWDEDAPGGEPVKASQIFVLDLSSIGDEAIEVATSVITRLIFDRLRRHRPRNSFPVNLILEEAHRYVPKLNSRASSIDAVRIFERVSKEGRKFGLFLLLSSQRPSELSGTVMSQCSNYIVHRIQNPEDLQHIRRMTPFISDAVLNRLASLPKQHALVFGTSVSVPTTFKVRSASPLPQSDDSRVSELWYRDPDLVSELPT